MRNAAWVSSGEMPTAISIGTNTGARIAHLDNAEVMIRFRQAVSRMMPNTVKPTALPGPEEFAGNGDQRADVEPNEYRNCAQKKPNTMNEISER